MRVGNCIEMINLPQKARCNQCTAMVSNADLPTHPYLAILVRKLVSSTDVRSYFSKYGQRVLQKVQKSRCEQMRVHCQQTRSLSIGGVIDY